MTPTYFVRLEKTLLLSCKIALGSSLAIFTAGLMNLEYSSSAGIVTLLTLITTKKGTVRLSLTRLVTFAIVVVLTFVTFLALDSAWLAYGLYIFFVVFICEIMNWRATISVNAVIGTHFLMGTDVTAKFLLNEFLVVAIGIFFAFVLNLFHDNWSQREVFSGEIRQVESSLQKALLEISKYLANEPGAKNVWSDLRALELYLQELVVDAGEYEGNTFGEDSQYYIRYFEMRLDQCHTLRNLQKEMQKIKAIPSQAQIVAEYIRYMSEYVTELNRPKLQLQRLDGIFQQMKQEPLPVSREEFENRAVLYHILMDLEEFLLFKRDFVRKEVRE